MEEENSTLRKKLLETLRSYSEQSAQLKQLELSVASMIETLNPVHVGQRETELSEALELMRTSGLKLVAKGKDLADAMEQQLQKIDEGSPQYRVVLRLRERLPLHQNVLSCLCRGVSLLAEGVPRLARAHRMPSAAADISPPASPAPSPQG